MTISLVFLREWKPTLFILFVSLSTYEMLGSQDFHAQSVICFYDN